MLAGELELDFPGHSIEPPRAPTLLGPLILLALHPRQKLSLEAFKAQLFDIDPALVSTSQIQTPISRLRLAGVPIPPRVYMLDVAPEAVDIVDFDTRAKAFLDAAVTVDRLKDEEVAERLDEAFLLHGLWAHDPGDAVGNLPRLTVLFTSHRRRHRRFGRAFVRLLLRAGEQDRAEHVLDQYAERYGPEVAEDIDLPRPSRARRGPVAARGPGAGRALAEVRDRVAATAHLDLAALALGAHNLDRIFLVDRLQLQNEALIGKAIEVPGGAAPNTVYALARFGQAVASTGVVADDRAGTRIREHLREVGVDLASLVTLPAGSGARTGHALIFVDPNGRRLTFIQPGANESLARCLHEDVSAWASFRDAVRRARIVHLSSFSGDPERRLQEDLLGDLADEVLVGFDPGSLYASAGLDRLAGLIARCDVLYAREERLRLMIDNSSSDVAMQPGLPFRGVLEALFRWRGARTDRPLVVAVKRPNPPPEPGGLSAAGGEVITLAVGRATVEDLVSARAVDATEPAAGTVGQGDAIVAAVHLGLLYAAPLDECADLVQVVAHEVASQADSRAGVPDRSSVAWAWSRYYPRTPLPGWVPRD